MSVKIKINWGNENVVSESVRIYRSNATITTPTQAMLIATILGDVYEYEDLGVIQDETYFYMLSAKLGEQEVFTECHEVVATQFPWYSTELVFDFLSNSAQYENLASTATTNNFSIGLSDIAKFSGAVLHKNGKIYAIPYHSTDILIVDPITNTATRSNMGTNLDGTFKWAGGVLANNGKIYCAPQNSADILIIDPITNTATRSNMGVDLNGTEKWYGGVLGGDGKIYCLPFKVMCAEKTGGFNLVN